MGISNNFLAIFAGIGLAYIFLFTNKVRWIRMIGCILIMVASLSLVIIDDNIPMMVLMLINLTITGITLTKEVSEIIS